MLVALGVIAFAVTITAVNCDKTAGGDGNTADNMNANNNTGGGGNDNGSNGNDGSGESGGNDVNNGNGGDIPTLQGSTVIRVENVDDSIAVLERGSIKLKASGFPSIS